jgi:hypothetical protein
VPLYQKTFKALTAATIVSAPLAPFDRAAAQRWWDHNSAQDKDKPTDVAAPPSSDAPAARAAP